VALLFFSLLFYWSPVGGLLDDPGVFFDRFFFLRALFCENHASSLSFPGFSPRNVEKFPSSNGRGVSLLRFYVMVPCVTVYDKVLLSRVR